MPEEDKGAGVTKSAFIVAVLIIILLLIVIIGSIVFAWRNGTEISYSVFRAELLETEARSLELQREMLSSEDTE